MTWVPTFLPVSAFPATTAWGNDNALHTSDKKKIGWVFISFLVDQRKTYNYYTTLSFTTDKLYNDFEREASKNFTEMSQRIESMVSIFPLPFPGPSLFFFTIIFSTLASKTSISLILHIFAK